MSPLMMNRIDGPAVVLSSQDPFQFAPSTLDASYTTIAPAVNGTKPSPSRKRSRDDAGFEEALNTPAPAHAFAPAPAPAPTEEPIYGEGMVLLNPRTGLGVSAESQTGTWYENKVASASKPPGPDHSRKAKRLDPSASGLDDIALSRLQHRDTDDQRLLDTSAGPEPPVDDATRLLGISWQRVADDDDKAPAVRGWTKYIDNQYVAYLTDSKILMKSRALNAFLVAARPASAAVAAIAATCYFLFSDDLDQARLVGSSWDVCVRNLRENPVVFEGGEVLVAADRAVSMQSTMDGVMDGPGMEIDH